MGYRNTGSPRQGLLALLLASVLFAPCPAQAGLQFEPYVGYWTGKLEQDSTYYMATSGLLFGSRVGLGLGAFRTGLDVMYTSGSGNQSGSTGEYTIREGGPYVGLEFPGLGQLYGSVFLMSRAKLQPEVNSQYYSGSGFRVGLGGFGWARMRSLSLNLEAISRSYNQYNSKDLSQKQKELTFALTMSLPLPTSRGSRGGSAPATEDATPSE